MHVHMCILCCYGNGGVITNTVLNISRCLSFNEVYKYMYSYVGPWNKPNPALVQIVYTYFIHRKSSPNICSYTVKLIPS